MPGAVVFTISPSDWLSRSALEIFSNLLMGYREEPYGFSLRVRNLQEVAREEAPFVEFPPFFLGTSPNTSKLFHLLDGNQIRMQGHTLVCGMFPTLVKQVQVTFPTMAAQVQEACSLLGLLNRSKSRSLLWLHRYHTHATTSPVELNSLG